MDKVADMPVAIPLLQFVEVVDDPVVQVVAGVVQFLDKVVDTPVVVQFLTRRRWVCLHAE